MCIHKLKECKKGFWKVKLVKKIWEVLDTTDNFKDLWYCGDRDKGLEIRASFKTLVSKTPQHGGQKKKLRVTINSYKK